MEKVVDFPTRQVRDIATIKRHLAPSFRAAGVSAHEEAQLFSALKPFLSALAGIDEVIGALNECASLFPEEKIARLDVLMKSFVDEILTERLNRELATLSTP